VACVEEACKEPVQKCRSKEKKKETAVGVEKSEENLCMWKNNIMRWNQDGRVVEVRERERALDVRKGGGESV
jgi:hypothetical protein